MKEARALVEPQDEHNVKLLGYVHPSTWTNPAPKDRYHLVVVGAGTAGLVSAAGAAGLGAKVALIERNLMGGDCLNVGCVPSKGVISAARSWAAARESRERFGGPEATGDGDFSHAMERMRRLRAGIAFHDSVERFSKLGIDVFLGDGKFTGPNSVEVGGKTLRFRNGVIATGGRAIAPPIPGLSNAGYLTNETVFELTEVPKRLAVIGGGPIGCEMAQAFRRFGTEVTLLDKDGHVLIREDADAAEIVQKAMIAVGVELEFHTKIQGVARRGNEKVITFEAAGGAKKELAVDHVLVAAGRAPNVEGLGLEAAGVKYGKTGVEVSDQLRTTNPKIFACGDVCSKFQFTHVADAQARIVIQNALFFGRSKTSALTLPWATYTTPEIAHVGMYEKDAKEKGIEVETLTVQMNTVDRAILDGEDEGFLRIHLKKGTDQILGATLVAEHAGDMLGELCLAVTHKIGLGKIASVIHPYPTQGEVIKKAADAYRRTKLTPGVKKFFERWFRVFR
ncbi:MAG: mercuric reductase [Acidobacteriota bacterium]